MFFLLALPFGVLSLKLARWVLIARWLNSIKLLACVIRKLDFILRLISSFIYGPLDFKFTLMIEGKKKCSYRYQLPPAQPNHTCGGADTWADILSSTEVFCSAGSYCPSTIKKNPCTSGY